MLVMWVSLVEFCSLYLYFLLCLICMLLNEVSATYHTNFVIKHMETCSEHNLTKFFANITTENGQQYISFDITLTRAFDDTVGSVTDIASSIDGHTFLPLFTIREKNFCKATHKLMGEFWYDIERAAQIPPGVCPIPKRRYYVHHLLLDYHKIALQTFPFGTLKIIVNAVDNTSKAKNSLYCLFMIIENVAN